MSQQQKSYLLPIVMMFALFAMISFVTGLPAPFGVIVQSEFGATNLEATLGFAANFIAYAFMGIPSGLLLQKIGYKKTALIAIAVGFICKDKSVCSLKNKRGCISPAASLNFLSSTQMFFYS